MIVAIKRFLFFGGIILMLAGVFGLSFIWSIDHRTAESLSAYCRIDFQSSHTEAGELEGAVEALLKNTRDEGTVVRWGSAYALARIIVLEPYKNSALVQTVREIYEAEKENGVKNQYKKALKHIKAI